MTQTNKDQAFIAACKNDNIEIIKLMIEDGANIHAQRGCALNNACDNNHIEVVELLIKYGANVHDKNNEA